MDITTSQEGSRKWDKRRTFESGATGKSVVLTWRWAENGNEGWMLSSHAEASPGVDSNAE